MSNVSMPWFRMYTDFLNDPKMIALAFEDQRHFIGILALKSDGALDQDCCPDLMDRIVAQRLWIDHAIIREVKKRLIAAGLIDEHWQPLAWNKRQMRSDSDPTNAARQARYKANKKAREAAANPPENKDGLSDKNQSNGGNALGNASVTGTDKTQNRVDTDKEEKTNKKENDADASGVCLDSDSDSDEDDSVYTKAKSKAAITAYCRSEGINATPSTPKLDQLMESGADMTHFVEAVKIAKQRKRQTWPYVLGIVGNLLADSDKAPVTGDPPANKSNFATKDNHGFDEFRR